MIAVALLTSPRVYLDFGVGKHRKGLWLENVGISKDLRKSIIGFHSFFYVSTFFRKGKATCFKVKKGNTQFSEAFTSLGNDWSINKETSSTLENFVCKLYGHNEKEVNKVRKKIFDKKYKKERKITDLSVMPPCRSVLRLHTHCANYVAKIYGKQWKYMATMENEVNCPDITQHSWNDDGRIKKIENAFPEDIEEILLHENFGKEFDIRGEDNGALEFSDDEEAEEI